MEQPTGVSILNGRLVDPANGVDEYCDLHVEDGKILALGAPPSGFLAEKTIDASGLVVCPGLIDLCAYLREPGQEHKATIASETRAAASAGITSLCCAPDTDPVIDTPAVAELVLHKAKQSAKARVWPTGALTQGLEGLQLSEMAALKEAGCIVLSNCAKPLANTLIERRAFEYATTFDMAVFLHPEDPDLADNGCVHEGQIGTRLGLPGIPEAAETVAVARDLALAEQTEARIHFRGLSTAGAARLVGRARFDNPLVSADVSIHQLHLTETDIDGFNSLCHVKPPLRTLSDRDALRRAVASGAISAICSDHQPHEADAKDAPFPSTAPGISGLETLLSLTLKLVDEKVLTLPDAIARLTVGPARILRLPLGQLGTGAIADICIFDPDARWRLKPETMISRGLNTPFLNWELGGLVLFTLLDGQLVFERGKARALSE